MFDFFTELREAIKRADTQQEPFLNRRNCERRADYTRRSADIESRDPNAWHWRELAGESVKRRVARGPNKLFNRVTHLLWRRQA